MGHQVILSFIIISHLLFRISNAAGFMLIRKSLYVYQLGILFNSVHTLIVMAFMIYYFLSMHIADRCFSRNALLMCLYLLIRGTERVQVDCCIFSYCFTHAIYFLYIILV